MDRELDLNNSMWKHAWYIGQRHHGIFLHIVERILVCYEIAHKISALI